MNTRSKKITLARFLLGVTDPDLCADHINGNTLDNRKCNLRIASKTQNNQNRGPRKSAKVQYVGVKQRKNKFGAFLKDKWLGTYDTAEQAAKARDNAAKKEFGLFARLNLGEE